jgi:subfamily B ATP-binding cassette protein MsbA
MKAKRPSIHQRRLDAILDMYRDKETRPGAERRHLLRLWHEYIYPLRRRLALGLIFTLLIQVQPYVWAYMAKICADTILMVGKQIPPGALVKHLHWAIILFFANGSYHVLNTVFIWQNSYQLTLIGQRVVFELRKELHQRLQQLPLSFFDGIQTGRLLSVVVDDVETIRMTVANTSVQVCSSLAMLLIGFSLLFVKNWHMALLAMLALPLYVLTFRNIRPLIREANIAARRATSTLYSTMEERVTGIRTVKAFGRERAEVRSFTESVNNLARLTMYIVRLSTIQTVLATIITALATGLILTMGILQVRHGTMSVGTAMMLYAITGTLFGPALIIGDLYTEFQRISVVMRRVFDIMEAEPEPPDRPTALALPNATGTIDFSQVTFTYPGDESPSLRDLSFHIPAGKQVAVMGPSGAGKSTLLYLLMRFYDPEEGTITLDGHDLRDIKLLSLRDRITLVMQEPVIFSGTVGENIRYGRLDASDEEVRLAAKDADLNEFIMSLPDSYETVVGERGISLSGGQRQRLALATSLLSRPTVLLLDDTTSALDPATEARVRATLNRLMKGRTCFVVTHRISTAMACDLVLVLEEGRLTQIGTPSDLLTQDGLVRRVYEQQVRESADQASC